RRVARALDVGLELLPRSRGADLDRVLNSRHAALAEATVRSLRSQPGWLARPEVSFSIWGERGVVDVLAWHESSRSVVIIELKTAIVDVGEILGTLDRKRRLALQIAAAERWRPVTVSTVLLVAEGSTNRRRIHDHVATFKAALPDDGRRWRHWLRSPVVAINTLAFVSSVRPGNRRSDFSTLQRVRRRPASAQQAAPRTGGAEPGRRRPPERPSSVDTVPGADV
ncbi:MAG TPA: hypothetical protein VKC59_03540, partial [Candidatus Limnocylindrales bacterium]|nr:hypothetical protein [Candidatus Limnocylindrales bacterium]